QGEGTDTREKLTAIPVVAFCAAQYEPGDHPGEEGNAQVDGDALRNLPNADLYQTALQAKEWRQYCNEDPGIDAVEEHLKEAVKGNQSRRIISVAFGELVPDNDHRDTAGQPHENEPDHVFGIIVQEEQGQDKHKDRTNHPILNKREPQDFPVTKDVPQFFIAH